MRTLVLYRNDMGDTVSAMLTHSDDIDLSDIDAVGRVELALETDSILYMIEMPDDTFRPAVTDQFGDEIAMQFVEM